MQYYAVSGVIHSNFITGIHKICQVKKILRLNQTSHVCVLA